MFDLMAQLGGEIISLALVSVFTDVFTDSVLNRVDLFVCLWVFSGSAV